jgi:hypothetical protein
MKITIDRLKEIIKEEIAGTSPENVQQDQPEPGGSFDKQVNNKVRTILNRQQIQTGLRDLRAELEKYKNNRQMQAAIVGVILQQLGVDTSDQQFTSLASNIKSRTKE